MILPLLVSLAQSATHADPEEMSHLVERTNAAYETEMFSRAFGWVNSSNRSAEMDVTTWQGKAIIYVLWVAMSLAGYFAVMLEMAGLKALNEPRM